MTTDRPDEDPILGISLDDSADPDLTTASPVKPVDEEPEPPPVAEQRAELAETVDALHDRLDVRQRAADEASAVNDQIKYQAAEHRTALIGAAGAVLATAVLVVVLRRRRRR